MYFKFALTDKTVITCNNCQYYLNEGIYRLKGEISIEGLVDEYINYLCIPMDKIMYMCCVESQEEKDND